MRAVVLKEAGDLAVRSVPEPSPGPGEVLVEVAWCGICGTDRSIYHGAYGGRRLPLTLGHEFAGRVADDPTGTMAPGTPVVADINITCGRCRSCRLGSPMTCRRLEQIGVDRDGGFAPLVAVPATAIHVLPADLPLDVAAMTEPVACVVHSQSKLDWSAGGSVLVIGAGPVGFLQAAVARERGCTRVLVTDVRTERLDALAAIPGAMGIDAADDVASRVLELTGGEGVDVVIEASGAPAAYASAFAALRPGGQLLVFGIPRPEAEVALRPFDVLVRELSVHGSNGASPAAWPAAIDLLASSRIDVSPLLEDRIALDAVVERITGGRDADSFKSVSSPLELAA